MTDKDEIARLKREVTDLQRKLADEQAKSRDGDVAERDKKISQLTREIEDERNKAPMVKTKTVTQRDPKDEAKINAQRKDILELRRQLKEAQAVYTDRDVARLKQRLAEAKRPVERPAPVVKTETVTVTETAPEDRARIKRLERVVRKLRSRKYRAIDDRDELLSTVARLKSEVRDLQSGKRDDQPSELPEVAEYKRKMGVR